MNVIGRDELRIKLARGDKLELVMTMPEHAYRAKHLPASRHVENVEQALATLDPAAEIVVYCSNEYCAASIYAYRALERRGYARVRRYAGGVADWEAAGYPLESGLPREEARPTETPHEGRRAAAPRLRASRRRPWVLAGSVGATS